MTKPKFYLDQPGVQEVIYSNNTELTKLEQRAIENALAQVEAQYLQSFGEPGNFEIKFVRTKVGGKGAGFINGTRPTYRIVAADSHTAARLKSYPGWLGQFSANAKF